VVAKVGEPVNGGSARTPSGGIGSLRRRAVGWRLRRRLYLLRYGTHGNQRDKAAQGRRPH
ncbi:MAG: hypothetical protein AAFX85_20030, partial [Pseudomonadota bacterium]